MQVFKPFRATVHRKQKYYSQKRINEKTNSIFNLPKQVIEQPSTINLSSNIIYKTNQNIRSLSHQNKTFLHQYQLNLKKTIKKNSINISSRKTLQKATLSLIVANKNKISPQKINRNKSVDSVNRKNMSFQTLNILYRTIIETKETKKSKPKFQVNARKLPILQKSLIQNFPNSQIKEKVEVLVRNTPFSNKKRSSENMKDNKDRSNFSSNKQTLRNRTKKLSSFSLSQQNEDFHILNHQRRFERRPSTSMGMNEIMPWNQFLDVEQYSTYHLPQFTS